MSRDSLLRGRILKNFAGANLPFKKLFSFKGARHRNKLPLLHGLRFDAVFVRKRSLGAARKGDRAVKWICHMTGKYKIFLHDARVSCDAGYKFPLYHLQMAKQKEKNPALVVAGQVLERARGNKPVSAIIRELGELKVTVSVGRYQHWEAGNNAPKRDMWEPLSTVLSTDVGALYGASPSATRDGKVIPASAVLALTASIERDLNMLKMLCSETPTKEPPHDTELRPHKSRKKLQDAPVRAHMSGKKLHA